MESEIDFAEKDPAEKSNQFKYIFDVSLLVFTGRVELMVD